MSFPLTSETSLEIGVACGNFSSGSSCSSTANCSGKKSVSLTSVLQSWFSALAKTWGSRHSNDSRPTSFNIPARLNVYLPYFHNNFIYSQRLTKKATLTNALCARNSQMVGPNRSQIKFGPLRISKNGPNWQYRNVFNLDQIWNNGYVFRTHSYNRLYLGIFIVCQHP